VQFNSIHFLLFVPAVLAIYAMFRHRGQKQILLVASYVF